MNHLNSLLLEGVVTRRPRYSCVLTCHSPDGTMVCTFYLTSERVTASEKETGVFTVQTRGKLAETVRKHIHEGRGVRVVGRLKEVQWTGADGKRQSTVFIAAEHVEFHPEQLKKPPKKNRRSSTAQDK